MARRRRRYSGLGSMVQIPGLGVLNKSVNTTDVLMGAAIGFAGTGALKWAGNKFLAGKLPDALLKGSPLVGGILSGAAAYYMTKKKSAAKANGYLFGAVMAGASVQAWDMLKTSMPDYFGDVVSLRLSGHNGGYGVLLNEGTPGLSGLVVDEPGRNLSQLAAYSMGEDADSSGMEELMEMD